MSGNTEPRYQDEIKFLQGVIEKFRGAKTLSSDDGHCYYGPEINGIGCAVGCMVEPADAKIFDQRYDENIYVIAKAYPDLYQKYFPANWVHDDFREGTNVGFLEKLQACHDNAADVEEFLVKVKRWQTQLKEEKVIYDELTKSTSAD